MTAQDLSAILDDAVTAAGKYHWDRLRAFAAGLPDDHDPTVQLLASPDTESAALARWIASMARPAPVRTESLELIVEHPELAVQANRVIAALRCGELLTPETVESAAQVVSRPAGSYLIVLTGAELIRSDDDLALVQRSIWRLILAPDGGEWSGQNLGEYHCVLWSDAETAAFLAERIGRDREMLTEWLSAEVNVADRLRAARVDRALDMAEPPSGQRLGTLPDPDIAARRAASAREAAANGRRRVLDGLEANAQTAEREITASLAMHEQDLLKGVAAFIAQHRDEVADMATARSLVGKYAEDGLRRWQAGAEASLRAQSERIADNLRSLVNGMEWPVIDRAGGPYPRTPFTAARLETSLPVGAPAVPEFGGARKGQFASGAANVVVGGAIGASVGAAVGAGLGVAPGLIVGAAGGLALNRVLAERNAEHVTARARTFITGCVATTREAALTRFRQAVAEQRATVTAAFDDLDHELAERVTAAEPDGGAELIAELRERLRSARALREPGGQRRDQGRG
jgi:hypothetical protein